MLNTAALTTLAATTGIISSSAFYTMNQTANHVVFPLLFLGPAPKSTGQPRSPAYIIPSTATPASPLDFITRQWKENYERGFRAGTTLAAVSGVSFLSAAYLASSSASPSTMAWLLVGAAAVQMAAGPYTWFVILPTNTILHRRADEIGEGAEASIREGEGSTVGLIHKWIGMNNTRAHLGLVSALLGVAALVMLQ